MTRDLSKNTVAELKDMAKYLKIKGYSKMKKAELIEAIELTQDPETIAREQLQITDILQFDYICKVNGRSGLWIPIQAIKSKSKVIRFKSIEDENVKTMSFNGFKSLGQNIHMLASFNAAWMSDLTIEQALEAANKFSKGEKKTFAEWYKLCEKFALEKVKNPK